VDTIIRAAADLASYGVEFQIIGKGTTYERDRGLADSLNLKNIRFIDWVKYEALADAMCRADVCLGFFADRERSYEVFTNKVVEALAVKRPLITMRNVPVSELLTDGESVLFVEPGDPADLARAILTLKNDGGLHRKLAEKGYEACQKHCTLSAFAGRLDELVHATLKVNTTKSGKRNK
jgi:glycosyltransferase involved in cell wall biosynthesis